MSIVRQRTRVSGRVTQLQSQKLVESILGMSFGCIAFLRGFFDDDHFEDQRFIVNPGEQPESKQDSIRVKMLIRGQSQEADTLLDWLDVSITESLQLKYLRGVCLSIILDEKKPEDLFESYTFQIEYGWEGQPVLTFDNDLYGDILMSPLTASRKQLQQLMRRFVVLTQSLPDLPAKRFLSMRLLFNESCPKSYQPELFVDCSEDKQAAFKVPLATDKDLEVNDCGSFETKHHHVISRILTLSSFDKLSKRDGFKEVDPFDCLSTDPFLDNPQEVSQEVSQITEDLKSMANLHNFGPATQVAESLAVNTLNPIDEELPKPECVCGSSEQISYSSLLKCQKCSKQSHAVCYGYVDESVEENFECITCSGVTVDSDIELLLYVRKMAKLLSISSKNPPVSFGDLVLQLGYTTASESNKEVQLVAKALTILIYSRIVVFSDRKTNGFFPLDVAQECVLVHNEPLKKGKYYFAFNKAEKKEFEKLFDPATARSEKQGINRDAFESIENTQMNSSLMNDANKSSFANTGDSAMFEFEFNEKSHQTQTKASEFFKKRKVSKSFDVFQV